MAAPNPHAPDLIEDYIDGREAFAPPILLRLRAMIHQAHPEIVEDWKWRLPAFCLNGRTVCLLGGFKKHATLVFCEGKLLNDWAGLFDPESTSEVVRTVRFRAEKDLDPGVLFDYLAQACALAEAGPLPAANRCRTGGATPCTCKKFLADHPKALEAAVAVSPDNVPLVLLPASA